MSDSLSTEAVLCNQCGAQLPIEENTKFVICSFCNCQLKVRRSGGGVYSEIIEEIQQRQDHTDNRVQILELENQLLKLEQEWDRTKKQFMIYPDKGKPYLPDERSEAGTVIAVIAIIIGAFVFIGVASQIGGGALLLGIPFACLIVFGMVKSGNNRTKYTAAKTSYIRQRSKIEAQLARLKSES